MKRLLFYLFIVLSFQAAAQKSQYDPISRRQEIIAAIFDSTLHIPAGGATPSVRYKGWSGSGAIWLDSINHRLLVLSQGTWRVVSGVTARWGLTKSNDSIDAGGKVDGIIGYYVRNNYSPGTPSTSIEFYNHQTKDSIFDGSATTALNRPASATDPTYQSAMVAYYRDFKEKYKDTAHQQQYGGVALFLNRFTMDSSSTMFGKMDVKKYWMQRDNGVSVTNQFFPMRDTLDVFVGQDGQSGSSYNSLFGLGGTWGYNIRVFSNLPQYPYAAGYNSVMDFQREASRTRMRRATGNGFYSYVSSWKSWQANITGATTEVGHYNQLVGGLFVNGSTDWNIGSSTTKEKVLAVSTVDTSVGVTIMPQWRPYNEVKNGIGIWQRGDDDRNIFNGENWFKDVARIRSVNTVDFNNPGVLYIEPKDSTSYVYIGKYGSTATMSVRGKYFNGGNTGGIDAEINNDLNSTAAFRLNFYTTAGAYDRRYHLGPKRFYVEVVDSVSFQAPAYKFAGMPTGVKSRVVMQDASGYLYSADTSDLFDGSSPSRFAYLDEPLYPLNDSTIAIDTGAGRPTNVPYVVTIHLFDSLRALSGGGSGEVNTASNLGGGLANYSTKVGVDLRFNSFSSTDFDLTSNLFTIDYTNAQAADNSHKGFLTSADWTAFNDKPSNNFATGDLTLTANRSHSLDGHSLTLNNAMNGNFIMDDDQIAGFVTDGAFAFNNTFHFLKNEFISQTTQGANTRYNYIKQHYDYTELYSFAPGGTSYIHIDSTQIDANTATFLLGQTSLKIKGASATTLTIKPNETLSAARTLNIVTGDANRTLTFAGDATISGTNSGDQTTITGNAGTATALQNARTLWGQSFNGTANVTGSLTSVGDITGGASNMTITAGTGNSRTLTLQTTTSGGVATNAVVIGNDQNLTMTGTALTGTTGYAITGGTSANNVLLLKGNSAAASNTATNANVTVLVGNSSLTTAQSWLNNGNSDFNNNSILNATLTAPKIANGGFLADANGNELMIYTSTGSAVNEVTFANAATGTNPKWTASGGDTDIGFDWLVKAAGKFRFLASASGPAELRLFEDSDNGTNYTGIIAPASIASNTTITLPDATTTLVGTDATQNITNKNVSQSRWVARVGSTTSSATPTINTDNVDIYKITALAADITSMTTNLSGAPNDGDVLKIEITGTATRNITWGASFVNTTATAPTSVTGTTTTTFVWSWSTTSSYGANKWQFVRSY